MSSMRIYYHRDGSQTISRAVANYNDKYEARLRFESVRIVELGEDGSINVIKDQWQGKRQILSPLPVPRVDA